MLHATVQSTHTLCQWLLCLQAGISFFMLSSSSPLPIQLNEPQDLLCIWVEEDTELAPQPPSFSNSIVTPAKGLCNLALYHSILSTLNYEFRIISCCIINGNSFSCR